MKIVAGMKAAAKSLVSTTKSGSLFTGPKARSFHAADKQVECPHCENILFHQRKASLNTAVSSMTNTEWTDPEACILVCANCSRLLWFLDGPAADADA